MPNPGWRIECPARQSGGTNGRNAANCGRLSASFTQSFSDNPLLRWLSRAKEGTDCDWNGCYGSPATLRTARAPRGAHVANKTVTPRAATWTATDSAVRVHGNGAFPGRLAGPGASPQPIHARATARTRSATALHAGRAPVSPSVYSTTRILAPHKDESFHDQVLGIRQLFTRATPPGPSLNVEDLFDLNLTSIQTRAFLSATFCRHIWVNRFPLSSSKMRHDHQ